MKLKFLSIAFLAAGLMAAMSCEKEEIGKGSSSSDDGKLKSAIAPYFKIDAVQGTPYCGTKTPCGSTTEGFVKNNAITLTNLTYSFYPGATYTVYKRISVSVNGITETYQAIGQYYCTSSTFDYVSGALPNNTKILVFANAGTGGPSTSINLLYDTSVSNITNYPSMSSPSDFALTLTGNSKGKPCADEEPPCSDCDPT